MMNRGFTPSASAIDAGGRRSARAASIPAAFVSLMAMSVVIAAPARASETAISTAASTPPSALPAMLAPPPTSPPPMLDLVADNALDLTGQPRASTWTLAQADPIPAPGDAAQGSPSSMSETPPAYGPPSPPDVGPPPVDPDEIRRSSFGEQVGAVKWELALGIAFFTATNLSKDLKDGRGFHFDNEGYFGDDTANLGVDKMAHAFNDALISDILYARMIRKTGEGRGPAATAALLGFGLQLYGEIYDGFEKTGGWSWQDVSFDAIGSVFSYFRNTVPGLRDKLDLRILITPDHQFYTPTGKAHFEQQRFLFALKLSGFEGLKHSPLRFVELHAGYYATGFTTPQRNSGEPLVQRPFVGIGFNLQELFFPHPTGWLSKAGRTVLEYLQLPYTAASVDSHGRVSY